ncbi:hypothetical protein BDV93DRAFT_502052 [Ceratobasidium sp. AG-I]|nr:hypothetical protein BDV93DRAFT_502052 [Ceratobasidium sp. AG-I]
MVLSTGEPYLWGVVIGIDKYQAEEYKSLNGAVADANDMAKYLQELIVPEEHINVLLNSEATRAGIIGAIQALSENPLIKEQDPIVIFFAGHGCALKRPADWAIGDSHIQGIVPYDTNTRGPDGELICAIPDYTINALLGQLASVKGDNITVIFDCCHSGSGTRIPEKETYIVRSVNMEDVPPLKPGLDKSILDTDIENRGKGNPNGYVKRGLLTHVLLAACAPHEEARETDGHGDFTAALLEALRASGVERMTYKRCIHILRKLPGQHPQCEGYYINRRLFDSRTLAVDHAFIKVQYQNGELEITESFPKSQLYALQIEAGPSEAMRVHFTAGFSKGFRGNTDWDAAFCSTTRSPFTLTHSAREAAQMIVDINKEGRVTFETGNPIARSCGLSVIPNTVPLLVENVLPVLRAAAKWAWHVERAPGAPLSDAVTDTSKGDLANPVEIEFVQVELATDTKHSKVVSGNHNQGGIVDIAYNSTHYYGINLVNKSPVKLYPYLFYFDVSEQSIVCIYKPPVVQDKEFHVAPLEVDSKMAIGYGTDGWNPLAFEFDKEQRIDVAILRLFVSTSYIDLDSVELTSPFEVGSRGVIKSPPVVDENWGVVTMGLVVRS